MPGPDIFDGMTVLQKQTALSQAQTAYTELMTGSKGVTFSYQQATGGRTVSYTQASVANLTMFIKQLQVSLGLLGRSRRPMRFIF